MKGLQFTTTIIAIIFFVSKDVESQGEIYEAVFEIIASETLNTTSKKIDSVFILDDMTSCTIISTSTTAFIVEVFPVCQPPLTYQQKNTCLNCTQCKVQQESLIDSCTATTDTLCTRICPLGSVSVLVSVGTSEQCTLCPAGKFATKNSIFCETCKDGYYSDVVGQSTCIPCAQGMFTSRLTGFVTCQQVHDNDTLFDIYIYIYISLLFANT
jgi:hypothetical protein